MKLTDLIIKRFYQELEQNKEHRNSVVAEFDDTGDLDLENIETSGHERFSHTCESIFKLWEVCGLSDKELGILINEMKYAALEELGGVVSPLAALCAIDRCAYQYISDIDGGRRSLEGSMTDEQAKRLIGSLIKCFYRLLDSEHAIYDLKDACQHIERLIDICGLRDEELSAVYDEMKCAVIERSPDNDEAIDTIEMINGLEEASCHE